MIFCALTNALLLNKGLSEFEAMSLGWRMLERQAGSRAVGPLRHEIELAVASWQRFMIPTFVGTWPAFFGLERTQETVCHSDRKPKACAKEPPSSQLPSQPL